MEDTMTRVIDAQCMTLSVAVWERMDAS
ncbi:hypothetical protein Tco_0927680, partial [Tanacetum coccineum]